jgi:hypothetical protein
MKKVLLLSALALSVTIASYAQTASKPLKKTLELKMAKTVDDDMPGTRGAGVVWHPLQKKYYAVFAGNVGYPLCMFDANGKRLSDDNLTTQFDIRGMWYNPVSKKIQLNGFADFGWAEYKLDAKGVPTEATALFEGKNQPDDQSTGTYNPKAEVVYFFNADGNLDVYDIATAEATGTSNLHLGQKKKNEGISNEDLREDYNNSALYTGLPGAEIALLNVADKKIELYNLKNGYMVKEMALPEGTPVEMSFNFAYTNNAYWLFDIENRTWLGFK